MCLSVAAAKQLQVRLPSGCVERQGLHAGRIDTSRLQNLESGRNSARPYGPGICVLLDHIQHQVRDPPEVHIAFIVEITGSGNDHGLWRLCVVSGKIFPAENRIRGCSACLFPDQRLFSDLLFRCVSLLSPLFEQ
jgi:hypothetical protein